MNQDFEKELRRAEREKEQARRVESFWDAFRLTENGHVKSTLLLNSFCLSILFLAVYGAVLLSADRSHSRMACPCAPGGRKSGQRAAPRPDRDSNLRADPPDLPPSDCSGRIRLALAAGPRQSGDHAAPAAGRSRRVGPVSPALRYDGPCAAADGFWKLLVAASPQKLPLNTVFSHVCNFKKRL